MPLYVLYKGFTWNYRLKKDLVGLIMYTLLLKRFKGQNNYPKCMNLHF